MTIRKIPGVYSSIDASAAVSSLSPNETVIGIIAEATSGEDNKPYAPINIDDAKTKFGANSNLVKLMETAMKNGGNKFILVKATAVVDVVDYETALEALELEEAVSIVITDSDNPSDFTKLKSHVTAASDNRKERITIVGFNAGTDLQTVISGIKDVNSGRVYAAYPNPLSEKDGSELSGIYGAAAIAGAIAAETDPSMPMTNVELKGFAGLSQKLKDSEMEALIDAGVIPLEVNNGTITIVRAISTYTKDTNNMSDITWQELTTTRISDYIMKDLRTRLRKKFARAKQSKDTRDGIKSEMLSALIEYQTQEYIEEVQNTDVSVEINKTNPLQNDVDFNYNVTGPLNAIELKGHLKI